MAETPESGRLSTLVRHLRAVRSALLLVERDGVECDAGGVARTLGELLAAADPGGPEDEELRWSNDRTPER